MFSKLLVPVDLAHQDRLERALKIAGKMAQDHGASVIYVGVFDNVPTIAGGKPEECAARLEAFSEAQAKTYDIKTESRAILSADPTGTLQGQLMAAIKESGSDAVVMASHIPGFAEHFFSSNAGYIASHAPVSVFVVR